MIFRYEVDMPAGSNVNNIKFDPNKQKLVICEGCKREMVVGKFAKNNQRCAECKNLNKKKPPVEIKPVEKPTNDVNKKFGAKLEEMCLRLGYSITEKRSWMKRYAIDGGGAATIYIMPEQSNSGMGPRVEYFSLIIQRAIGVNEDFGRFMPPDAVSDCEVLANEFAPKVSIKPRLGQEQCAICKEHTDEFGVDTKNGRILCIKPNNCFKKHFNRAGAESVG